MITTDSENGVVVEDKKGRALECPKCRSGDLALWGYTTWDIPGGLKAKYRKYRCNACGRRTSRPLAVVGKNKRKSVSVSDYTPKWESHPDLYYLKDL